MITMVIEMVVMLASVLLYRICLIRFEEMGFAEYSILRRAFSFAQPILMLGIGVGLPRYLSLQSGKSEVQNSYLWSALWILLSFFIVGIGIISLFTETFAFLLFGSEEFSHLLLPLGIMLGGIVLHSFVYSYLRGVLHITGASILQFINLGIVPLSVMFAGEDLPQVLWLTGIMWFLVSVVFFIALVMRNTLKPVFSLVHSLDLLKYGVLRLPGDLAVSFFFMFPVLIVMHYTTDIKLAGYVAFSGTLINLVGAIFTPICIVLLSKAGKFIAEKRADLLRTSYRQILLLTLGLVIPGVLIFEVFTEIILKLYLSEADPILVQICRIMFWSAIGYSVYISLRSILDALFVMPVNTVNILASMFVFLAFSFGMILLSYDPLHSTLAGFVLANTLLGGLTIWRTSISLRNFERN